MATLEQELMADFADSGDEDIADLENDFAEDGNGDIEDEQMVDEEADYVAEQSKKQKQAQADIQTARKLMTSITPLLERISEIQDHMEEVMDGESIEENPEFELLREANEFSTQIDSEIHAVHTFIQNIYSVKFPFLDQLVQNPLDFAKTAAILQNGSLNDIKNIAQRTDNFDNLPPLKNILNAPLLMVVIVEGVSAAKTRDLTEEELEVMLSACKLLLDLDKAKGLLIAYVQSRMTVFAPNLTAIVGSLCAAQLINWSGGLASLSQTPACNLAPLGSNKVGGRQLGLATNVTNSHEGFIYHSPLLQTVRPDSRKQALRIVSGKVILAARVDRVRSSPDGEVGRELKEECERRIDKLSEAGKHQGVRALPAPDDKPSRKRGGRRARKAKEATAMTEIRKAQNRMAFGKEEKEVGYGDSTKGMGMIGATDTGRLRAQQIDPKTRAKLSKKNPGWGGDTTLGAASSLKGFGAGGTATSLRAQGLRTGGVGLGGAGTSSIAFTPVQGLELVDPRAREDAKRKREAEEDRWFKGGTFTQLGGKVDAGGFKVPALPMSKKAKSET
jgi:U4/U6 small nuclear ribonucleoprotein PRP31